MNLYQIITTLQGPALASALNEFVVEKLPEFKQVLAAHPFRLPGFVPHSKRFKGEKCSISVVEAFWAYYLAQALQPQVIIESGSLHGFSVYFLARAAPQAEVHCFDPIYAPEHVAALQYHAYDWTEHDFHNLPGQRTLIFFDDHVHQGERVQQARARGVRHLLFHDNYLEAGRSHVTLHNWDAKGCIELEYVFPMRQDDLIFTSRSLNPQNYRRLTYVRIKEKIDEH